METCPDCGKTADNWLDLLGCCEPAPSTTSPELAGVTPEPESRPCGRCGGSGKIRGYEHVAGGICFRCSGSGREHRPSYLA